ncbi:MAG TPA: DMT family transporter [Usitatibacter sp.]|nr:DMT family transporter [Usitatibacter sp.]
MWFLPGLFVFIWATGFIVAGIVATRADPLTFLTARHALSIVVFVLLSLAAKVAWPRNRRAWRDAMVAGMLLHGLYIGGVFWAVSHGLPAGFTALVTALHPMLTAMLALPLLHERLVARQWIGIAVGVAGVGLIVAPKVVAADGVPLLPLFMALLATLSLTLGTIWQKRSRPQMDLRVNAAIQFMGAFLVTAPVAALTEVGRFEQSPALWGALAWAVLGLSVGGISIMLALLKRGAASRVAPLLYLSPPLAALIALALFGEAIGAIQVVGMVLAVAGAFAARH